MKKFKQIGLNFIDTDHLELRQEQPSPMASDHRQMVQCTPEVETMKTTPPQSLPWPETLPELCASIRTGGSGPKLKSSEAHEY